MPDMKPWLRHALNAADLMQGYVNLVIDRLDELDQDQKDELGCEIQRTDVDGPEGAAALAIIAHLLEYEKNAPKPPEGSVWVKVDPFDFEEANDEVNSTTHYGGEIRITNDTAVDITINCHGDDRGDDHCYWPTTEAVLSALFHTVVPGVVDEDYATNWEDFHENLAGTISPMCEPVYVFVDREAMAVVILKADGERFTHPIPLTQGGGRNQA